MVAATIRSTTRAQIWRGVWAGNLLRGDPRVEELGTPSPLSCGTVVMMEILMVDRVGWPMQVMSTLPR